MISLLATFIIAISSWTCFGEEAVEKKPDAKVVEEPTGVGPNKGVLEATKENGFKLSEKAVIGLGVSTTMIGSSGSAFTVPMVALLSFQDEMGIYRFRNGFYKLVELKSADVKADASGKFFRISSAELKVGDHVADKGADMLRLADLNIWGGEEGGE